MHSADAKAVLRPLFTPQLSDIPDCLTPTATMPARGGEPDAESHLQYLADLSAEVLLREIETEFAGTVPSEWRPVVDRPAEWIRAYAALMRAVWDAFEPVWRAAVPVMTRETERFGAALVRGRPDAAFSGMSNRIRFTNSTLHLPDPAPQTFELAHRRLALVPIVGGDGACAFAFDHPDLAWVGYPLPGLGDLDTSSTPSRAEDRDTLSVTIGAARAALLRSANTPRQMGELATMLSCSPSTLTHHCTQLEAAGLLHRERQGRHVRLTRTERGDALIDLLP